MLVETGETGQVSAEGDQASRPTVEAAEAVGCPTKTCQCTIKGLEKPLNQ